MKHSTTAQALYSVTRKSLYCYIVDFCYVTYFLTGLLNMLSIPYIYQVQIMPSIEEMKEV